MVFDNLSHFQWDLPCQIYQKKTSILPQTGEGGQIHSRRLQPAKCPLQSNELHLVSLRFFVISAYRNGASQF
jgi:hypothetical protein